jgi:hypothetical protein
MAPLHHRQLPNERGRNIIVLAPFIWIIPEKSFTIFHVSANFSAPDSMQNEPGKRGEAIKCEKQHQEMFIDF